MGDKEMEIFNGYEFIIIADNYYLVEKLLKESENISGENYMDHMNDLQYLENNFKEISNALSSNKNANVLEEKANISQDLKDGKIEEQVNEEDNMLIKFEAENIRENESKEDGRNSVDLV